MTIEELKQRITAAQTRYDRSLTQSDRDALWKLQSEYRNSGIMVTSSDRGYGGSVTVGGANTNHGSYLPPSRPSISMSEYVLDRLRAEDWDGREQGLWLVGDRELDVTAMTGRTDPDDSTRQSCIVDFEQAQAIERSLPDAAMVTGHYHCQPESVEASAQDLVLWERAMDALNRDSFVGIIIRASDPFDVKGYVMRRENGEVVCRPAEIATWRW